MRIFVINLASRADRRESVARQFAGSNLDYEFFQAAESTDALEKHFTGRSDFVCLLQLQRKGTASEIACYASHLCLWQVCVDLNEPVIVLEDDFAATENFKQAIDFAAKQIDRYGFIRLEPMEIRRKNDASTLPLKVTATADFALYFQTAISARATGYAINPVTARRFIDCSRKFTLPVDHFQQQVWIHKMPMFVLDPPAIGLTNLADESSIFGREHKSGSRFLLRPMRKLYRSWKKRAMAKANAQLMRDYPELFR